MNNNQIINYLKEDLFDEEENIANNIYSYKIKNEELEEELLIIL